MSIKRAHVQREQCRHKVYSVYSWSGGYAKYFTWYLMNAHTCAAHIGNMHWKDVSLREAFAVAKLKAVNMCTAQNEKRTIWVSGSNTFYLILFSSGARVISQFLSPFWEEKNQLSRLM